VGLEEKKQLVFSSF